jgi:periplasmic protein TonB
MKLGWIFGIVCAVMLHIAILLFGGALVPGATTEGAKLQQVELLAADEEPKKEKIEEPAPEEKPLESDTEKAPDAAEILKSLEQTSSPETPALDVLSLGALEQALSGGGAGGDFGESFSLSSGGRLDGRGRSGTLDEKLEQAFSMAEIDQKPHAVFQAAPLYPNEMRGKKVEGVVTLIFVVDAAGKVTNIRIEKSSNPAFEKPATDAVRQWKFEPAVKGGQRVACRMRVPIRFQPS